MAEVTKLPRHDEPPDGFVDDSLPPKVEPGLYQVAYVEHRTALMFQGRAPKLIMRFRIVDQGKYYSVELNRYYNVKHLIGKQGRNGGFKATLTGDFAREYYTLFQGKHRPDRIPMSPFKSVLIEAEVATVKHARGQDIPEAVQYSRIKRLVRLL